MEDSVVIAFTTFPDAEQARQIGTELVTRQWIACVNLFPAGESIYRWEGAIHCEREIVAMMKTSRSALAGLEKALRELHPYTCPELIVLPVESGLSAYLDWVLSSVGKPAGQENGE